jgi:SOS response regulatory protein OraA/RecX
VRDYLIPHGYDAKTAEIAAEEIPDEEIREALTYHLTRKFRNYTDLPMAERKKATASLTRLGFTYQEIRNTAEDPQQN